MSEQTLAAVEEAIAAHMNDIASVDPESEGVVTDWVVAVCMSKIDDDNQLVYRNVQFAPNNNPNGQASLHAWASAEIMEFLAWNSEEED